MGRTVGVPMVGAGHGAGPRRTGMIHGRPKFMSTVTYRQHGRNTRRPSLNAVATTEEIASLLVGHDVPPAIVEELVEGLPGTLLLDEPAEVLAADLALCHPPLAPSEVGVQLRPADGDHTRRITVVSHDRPGLLAATAGALAERGLSVVSAGAAT